jgi:hypothetical protein
MHFAVLLVVAVAFAGYVRGYYRLLDDRGAQPAPPGACMFPAKLPLGYRPAHEFDRLVRPHFWGED